MVKPLSARSQTHTSLRLNEADIAKLNRLVELTGLRSAAEAVRLAVREAVDRRELALAKMEKR